ncbi:hypothetical protein acdb102_15530 [Acidothermaceae bacterium B102]|nr:hypothetical protein acdb102_15530 [Acidothermaceae bacterium B102]
MPHRHVHLPFAGSDARWRSGGLFLAALLLVGLLGPIHLQVVTSWTVQALLYVLLTIQIVSLTHDPTISAANRRFWSTVRWTGITAAAAAAFPLAISLGSRGSGGAVPGLVHGIFGAMSVVALVWACLTYRQTGDNARRQLRRWLDAATVMAGGLGAIWFFESGPLVTTHVSGLSVAMTIILDSCAMVTLLALARPATSDTRPIVWQTGIMAMVAVIGGVVTELALPVALGTPWLRLVLLLRAVPAGLGMLAIRYQRLHMHEPATPARRVRQLYSRVPYAAVATTYAFLGVALISEDPNGRTWGMFTAAFAVTALVVIRQMNAFGDNARLVRDLTASVGLADNLAAELHHHAFYDALTGLPNRTLLADRLEHALAARVRSEADLAVMIVDLDDFKLVNDRCGHAEGDRVLREAARRLTGCLRAGDTVARLGGDEFAILVNGADQLGAAAVARRVVAAFEAPFTVREGSAELGVSVGVAMTDDSSNGARNGETLLRHADIAMYVAKDGGKRRYEVFVPAMLDTLVTRHDTTQALTRAIADDQLTVHYQPIVDGLDGQVRGVEALVRWWRPDHGMVPPLEFLGLAEQVGLIQNVDLFVLHEACRQVQKWNAGRSPADALSVHVNMSAMTLTAPDVVDRVAGALQQSGLPGRLLTIELTETALMSDPAATIARMKALKQTGVRLAIDDFGTGYSSLAYLRDLPLDTVKVDKSFVDRIVGDEVDRELVRTIVNLAALLGLDTVAEGVENAEQATLLSTIGCTRMQGYLFAPPVPSDQLESTTAEIGRAASWFGQAADAASSASSASLASSGPAAASSSAASAPGAGTSTPR